jgi:intracellular sulfur oxidation DsrE/DsrF family protein
MAHEEPRIMFFHYWGSGAAKDLANAVKGGFWLVACSRSVRRFKIERSLLRASPSERQEIDCTLPSNYS